MNKLKDAEPTMVAGPSSPAGSPNVVTVSIVASKISGGNCCQSYLTGFGK